MRRSGGGPVSRRPSLPPHPDSKPAAHPAIRPAARTLAARVRGAPDPPSSPVLHILMLLDLDSIVSSAGQPGATGPSRYPPAKLWLLLLVRDRASCGTSRACGPGA